MNWNDWFQDLALKVEYFIYKSAWLWMLLFILAVFAFTIYIHMSVWYECRAEGYSFFYCFFLTST